MNIQFVITGHSWTSKAGKTPVYKVSLKSKDGHSLTLLSDDRAIFEALPKGEVVDVTLGKAQRSMDEFTEEEEG